MGTPEGNEAMVRSYKRWAEEDPKRAHALRYPACLVAETGEALYRMWVMGAMR